MHSKYALILALSVTLAACGGGGGGSSSSDRGSGGSGGGSTPEPPRADYSGHYGDLGMQPDGLLHDLSVDSEVAAAVAPGYLGFGMLLASLDLRMSLQSYEWTIRDRVHLAAIHSDGDIYPSAECSHGGRFAVFDREGEPTREYTLGETVRFGFADCSTVGGEVFFRSDGPAVDSPAMQTYQRLTTDLYLFEFDTVRMDDYPSLVFTGGPLVRHHLNDHYLEMTFSNAAPGEAPGTLSITGPGIELHLPGADRGVSEPSSAHTRKPDAHLRFNVPHLAAQLALDGGSKLDGDYTLKTTSTLEVDYGRQPRLYAGAFEVEHEGVTYRFQLDPDPNYLYVEIDEDGDGVADASGRISQALVIGRYRLDE